MPAPTADLSTPSPAPASIAARRVRAGGPGPTASRSFPTPDAAERAGFRACRRCDPRAGRSVPEQKVDRARVWIETHPDLRPSLARLARVAGVSPWHLQRTFKRLLGVTPSEYARARRAARLKDELKQGRVTDAIYAAGFGSPSRVYDEATGVLGMTPRAYRSGGQGERIRFTTLTTRLGVMLVAATDRGLCRVALGDDAAVLEQRLRDEFPGRRGAQGPRRPGDRDRGAPCGGRRPARPQRVGPRRARHGVSASRLAPVATDPGR